MMKALTILVAALFGVSCKPEAAINVVLTNEIGLTIMPFIVETNGPAVVSLRVMDMTNQVAVSNYMRAVAAMKKK